MNNGQQNDFDSQSNSNSADNKKMKSFVSRTIAKLKRPKTLLKIAIVLAVLSAVGFFAYQYVATRNELNRVKNPDQVAKQEAQDIVDEISGVVEIPKDDQPTTATVTNKEKLQDQPFFENAENGDKVLVFAKAQQAILYRPSTKKVIQFAPVNPGVDSSKDTK